jgi:ligand-binding sensor domain-containing protein
MKNLKLFAFLLLYCTAFPSFSQMLKFQQLVKEDVLENQLIITIDQDRDGRIWFGGYKNLYYYDSYDIVNILKDKHHLIDHNYLQCIAVDSGNNLFLGTNEGLYIYQIDQHKDIS